MKGQIKKVSRGRYVFNGYEIFRHDKTSDLKGWWDIVIDRDAYGIPCVASQPFKTLKRAIEYIEKGGRL